MTTGYVISGTGATAKYTILKDPDAVLDYPFDWTDWLAEVSDTIFSATAAKTGSITIDSCTVNVAGLIVIPMISGGTPGETCALTVHIRTTPGLREDDRTIYIKIKER